MKRFMLTSHGDLSHELEQALAEWIDASRRAWLPDRNLAVEQAEDAAWRRLKSALRHDEVASAA